MRLDFIIVLLCCVLSTKAQVQGLYFMLNGTAFKNGDTLLINDVGLFLTIENAASSLVCRTDHVNTQCCRRSDGGNLGEWFFPNGSIVRRNSGNETYDFTRTGFTYEVRLNRRNNAQMPTGVYLCRVPDGGNLTVQHEATITLINIEMSVPATLSASEDDQVVSVCATLTITPSTAIISRTIRVSLNTSDGSASAGSDYTPEFAELTFSAGFTDGAMQCMDIRIISNAALEENETIYVTLTTSDTQLLGNNVTTITIIDVHIPGIYFTLKGTLYLPGNTALLTDIGEIVSQTQEGAGLSLVCVTSNVNHHCCGISDGKNVGEWLFPNGTTIPRSISNDFTTSGFTHQVRLNRRNNALMPTGKYSCRVPDGETGIAMIHTATITLIVVEVSVPTTLSVSKGNDKVSVCAALSISPSTAVTSRAIIVSLTTSDGTATSGLDYISVSRDLTFLAGARDRTILCINISIFHDNLALEGEETFTVALTTIDHIPILQNKTVITILNKVHITPDPNPDVSNNSISIIIVVSTAFVLALAIATTLPTVVYICHHQHHANSRQTLVHIHRQILSPLPAPIVDINSPQNTADQNEFLLASAPSAQTESNSPQMEAGQNDGYEDVTPPPSSVHAETEVSTLPQTAAGQNDGYEEVTPPPSSAHARTNCVHEAAGLNDCYEDIEPSIDSVYAQTNPPQKSAGQNDEYEAIEQQPDILPNTKYSMSNCPAYESQTHDQEETILENVNKKPKHADKKLHA